MSRPSRPSDPNSAHGYSRTFFATTRTAAGRSLFQTERMANLLIDVLRTTMRSDGVNIHEFVVMPNHFHAILCIGENEFNSNFTHDNSNKFGPQSKNLGSIIRGFKSTVSKQVRTMIPGFGWQERYHDNIIRNQESYLYIQQYILNNPMNWKEDKFYSG